MLRIIGLTGKQSISIGMADLLVEDTDKGIFFVWPPAPGQDTFPMSDFAHIFSGGALVCIVPFDTGHGPLEIEADELDLVALYIESTSARRAADRVIGYGMRLAGGMMRDGAECIPIYIGKRARVDQARLEIAHDMMGPWADRFRQLLNMIRTGEWAGKGTVDDEVKASARGLELTLATAGLATKGLPARERAPFILRRCALYQLLDYQVASAAVWDTQVRDCCEMRAACGGSFDGYREKAREFATSAFGVDWSRDVLVRTKGEINI